MSSVNWKSQLQSRQESRTFYSRKSSGQKNNHQPGGRATTTYSDRCAFDTRIFYAPEICVINIGQHFQGCASSSTHFDEEGAKNFIKYLTVYSKECEMIDQRVTDQYGHYLQLEDSISENQLNLKRKTEDMDRASGK